MNLCQITWGVALCLVATCSQAIEIKITDPGKKLVATEATCKGYFDKKDYKDCTSTATFGADSLSANDAEFKKSFDAWNGALAANKQWTLADGGKLPGGKFNVSKLSATVDGSVGGVEVRVFWDYAGKDKSNFQWTQGLKDNYLIGPPGKMVDPFYELDNGASKTSPLYPHQYDDRHFYDAPIGPMTSGSFAARAFLAQVDTAKRVLTLYEGLSYGFALSATAVPEPPAMVLALLGMAMIAARRRSRGVFGAKGG